MSLSHSVSFTEGPEAPELGDRQKTVLGHVKGFVNRTGAHGAAEAQKSLLQLPGTSSDPKAASEGDK